MSKICQKCGQSNGDIDVFCASCGETLGNSTTQQQAQYQPSQQQYQPQQQQYQPQQQQYQQTQYQPTNSDVSVGSWIGYMFLLTIPLVNIIVLIVLATGSSTKKSLKNWAIAQFVIMLIGVVLAVLFSSVLIGVFSSILDYA